jgi:hypothetical protein
MTDSNKRSFNPSYQNSRGQFIGFRPSNQFIPNYSYDEDNNSVVEDGGVFVHVKPQGQYDRSKNVQAQKDKKRLDRRWKSRPKDKPILQWIDNIILIT